jgi:hypothetical protein
LEWLSLSVATLSVRRCGAPTHTGGTMNEKEMQALLKKTMAKAAAKKNPNRPTYDKALDATRIDRPEASEDATEIFKEMKKRTF